MKKLTKNSLWVYPVAVLVLLGIIFGDSDQDLSPTVSPTQSESPQVTPSASPSESASSDPEETPSDIKVVSKASEALDELKVKGRAPKTGYDRDQFASDWGRYGSCDLRNYILQRDFSSFETTDGCQVENGVLNDPFTGATIYFQRGISTSWEVQIDHVVALSDAWQKGAQQLTSSQRYNFYNDPLNLLAVDGPSNSRKSDSDAASWLPPNKKYRCDYVARQVAVKLKYSLWVTQAEKTAIQSQLNNCPKQRLPKG